MLASLPNYSRKALLDHIRVGVTMLQELDERDGRQSEDFPEADSEAAMLWASVMGYATCLDARRAERDREELQAEQPIVLPERERALSCDAG